MKIIEDFFLQKGLSAWNFLPEEAIRLIYSVLGKTPLHNRPLEDTTGIAVLLPYRIFPVQNAQECPQNVQNAQNVKECPCERVCNSSGGLKGNLSAQSQAFSSITSIEAIEECPQSRQQSKQMLNVKRKQSIFNSYNEKFRFLPICNDADRADSNFLKLQIGSFASYDYYHYLARILKELAGNLRALYKLQRVDIRISVNSQLPEKECARLAELGWIGKSGLLVNQDYGSAVIIGIILFPKIERFGTKHARMRLPGCGDCVACITACPTHALGNGFKRELCLQYWMSHGGMPEHLKPMRGLRLYGCDNCIAECPYTKRAQLQAIYMQKGANSLHNKEVLFKREAVEANCEKFEHEQQNNNWHIPRLNMQKKISEEIQEKQLMQCARLQDEQQERQKEEQQEEQQGHSLCIGEEQGKPHNQKGHSVDIEGQQKQNGHQEQQGHSLCIGNRTIYDFHESQMTNEEKRPGCYIAVNKFTRMSPYELKSFFKGTALGLSWIPVNDFVEYIIYLQNLGRYGEN